VSNSITAIDGATGITTPIPLGSAATDGGIYGLGVNSRTNMIYVVDYSGDTTIIDGSDYTATTIARPGFGVSKFLAVNETANKVYVPHDPGSGS